MKKYNFELSLDDRNSLSVLLSRIQPNSLVLEFGPAYGRMTKYMKEQLNCKVYAVEIDEEAAKVANQYVEKIIIDDIENYNWKEQFKNLQFDYVIFADVLEHLYYPEKVLKSVRDLLKDDGSILVSVPNIAHNSIIINLLKNEFNYNQIGLLDNTHIRFFTKKTFDQLIRRVGYFIHYESAIFKKPEDTEFRNSYQDIPIEVSNYLLKQEYGEAYQLLYELKKYPCERFTDFSINHKINPKIFIQLYIEDENPISEETSIKLPVAQHNEFQKFKFDLTNRKNIKRLRLDPLNKCCVIEMKNIYIKKNSETIDLYPYMHCNAEMHQGKTFFFTTDDPQIYFNGLNVSTFKNAQLLIIVLKYTHIGKDGLFVIIEEKNKKLLAKQQIIRDLKKELLDMYTSKSWKITRPLRHLKHILVGKL